MFKIFSVFILLFSFSIKLNSQTKLTSGQRATSLLKKMTLDEKIGQMNQYAGFWELTGPPPSEENAKKKLDHLKSGMVGSMLNIKGVENVRKIQKMAIEGSRLGIPLIFGYDVIHGQKTLSPIPLAEAASWDIEAIEKSARIAAVEASAEGINWTFAPMVDISRDARWGRVMEGAGEDPYLGSKIAAARVKGFQGSDLSKPNTILACAKHFAGYGFSESGKDYSTVDVGTSTLYNVVFPPFKACIDAGVGTFMNSFNDLNGVPTTGNSFLLREILKGKWGFKGFVVSDYGTIAEMVNHGHAKDTLDASRLAIKAGTDMDMESYGYVRHLKSLVETNRVSIKLIDDAVLRILKAKYDLGLFDDPFRYCDEDNEKKMIGHIDHVSGVLDIAKKSMVLLKNDNNLLPLPKTGQKIALIGALANDKNSLLGSWRLASIDNSGISVLEGMNKYTGNSILYSKGPKLVIGPEEFVNELKINETDEGGLVEAVETAKNADIVVMVLGEHGFQSGEGRSRTNIDLPGLQQKLLEAVYAVNKNIVLVLLNGRPLTIGWAKEHIPAILEAWQPGTEGGNAIAQVLYGDYNPSGKLPMTFPKSVGQIPIYYNFKSTGRPGPKSQVFWAHYSDESNEPLFPFGYGLSYTTFEYSNLKVEKKGKQKVEVRVTIKNSGKFDGEEVAQLYLTDKIASITRPVKELKGFKKVKIEAGKSVEVIFQLSKEELGFYKSNGVYIVESGDFDVMVGGSSTQGLTSGFTIE